VVAKVADPIAIVRDLSAAERPRAAPVLPHPVLLRRFEEKVKDLRAALNDPAIRSDAMKLVQDLIETVTIHPAGSSGAQAEVVAETTKIVGCANDKGPSALALGPLDIEAVRLPVRRRWLRGQDLNL
jgi:hypothetical protein